AYPAFSGEYGAQECGPISRSRQLLTNNCLSKGTTKDVAQLDSGIQRKSAIGNEAACPRTGGAARTGAFSQDAGGVGTLAHPVWIPARDEGRPGRSASSAQEL